MTDIIDSHTKIRDLVAKHPIMSKVLERFGFDCREQADEDIATAAAEKHVDVDLLRLVLEAVVRTPPDAEKQ